MRANGYSWVSDLGLRGHARGKGGDFTDPTTLKQLSDPGDEDGKLLRQSIFGRIRKPLPFVSGDAEAIAQVNGRFMPALSGDEGDATTGNPSTWLSVTELQYRRLEAWANNNFILGDHEKPAQSSSVGDEPGILTRTALECCAGGAFYPGIEMTAIARSRGVYADAFRISDSLKAGDIIKFMAVPWQADFFECQMHWWPAQRPDSVITARSADELRRVFSYERKQGSLERLMLVRQPWARGLDTNRPDPKVIEARLLPTQENAESPSHYTDRIRDGINSVLTRLTAAATPVNERLPERVPTLGRVQYLIQEQFDVYGGRYFHFHVPVPIDFRK